jgi:hypothetical protein
MLHHRGHDLSFAAKKEPHKKKKEKKRKKVGREQEISNLEKKKTCLFKSVAFQDGYSSANDVAKCSGSIDQTIRHPFDGKDLGGCARRQGIDSGDEDSLQRRFDDTVG